MSPTPHVLLLEDCDKSNSPVAVREPDYRVLPQFQGASYAKRYQLFCEKAHRENLYDASALLTSTRFDGIRGKYHEPAPELSFMNLAAALYGRAVTFCKSRSR